MLDTKLASDWHCPQCGPLDRGGLTLYRPPLLNAHSKRLDPHCTACGATAICRSQPVPADAQTPAIQGAVLIITGTCSSGKSTISYLLAQQHQFIQIDGDWIWQQAKEQDPKIQPDDIHGELALLAANLASLGQAIALAHVISPHHLPIYERLFDQRSIDYQIAVLMPQVETLLARNQDRRCWPKTTPEYWVMKFYDEFLAAAPLRPYFYDNTDQSPAATAAGLARRLHGS
ncbi:MAG: hypothetical protein GKR89_06630 [Candidatus Latescibacteria bacterium]|nr:hypothetical protein [Candidatus Latescibacterota bacterium]